jgi:sarcosine oxidase
MGSDVGVIGAGIVGLATAFALAERGAAVTIYERGTPGAAQSGGESRIFRHGHDDPRLVALAYEARAAWREWEERFGAELVAGDGVVLIGPAAERRLPLVRGARTIGPDELVERLPIIGPAEPAMLDPEGGVIRTRAAVAALVGALGDRIVVDEVVAVRADGEVRVGGRTARHERVVVCAGRETATLAAGVGLDLPVRLSTHVRLTYPVRGAPPPRLACLQDSRRGAYGDPLPGNERYAVGLGDDPAETTAFVAATLPGLVPEPVEARHCWVTELPWGHDGLAVWEAGAVLFVAGNNLFKHAPALGRRIAAGAIDELRPEARLGAPGNGNCAG